MNDKVTVRTSKFLSLILRHAPERVGLKLGNAGWGCVEELLRAVNCNAVPLSLDELKYIRGPCAIPVHRVSDRRNRVLKNPPERI